MAVTLDDFEAQAAHHGENDDGRDFLDGDEDEEAFYRAWLQETLDSDDGDGAYDELKDGDFAVGDSDDDDDEGDDDDDDTGADGASHSTWGEAVPRGELQALLRDAGAAVGGARAPLATPEQLGGFTSELGASPESMAALSAVVRAQVGRHFELLVETMARGDDTDKSLSAPYAKSMSLLLELQSMARSNRVSAETRAALRRGGDSTAVALTRRRAGASANDALVLDQVPGLGRVDEVFRVLESGAVARGDGRAVLARAGVPPATFATPAPPEDGAMSFTPGEDALLLRGLQLFGESAFDRVQKQLLPAKSKELLMFRVQTLAKAADGNGVARFRSRRARRPKGSTKWQSYDDRVLALGATGYAREWTAIQQELLPHRQTSDMRKRWKKIEAAWAPKLAELKASGADLKAKAAEARLVRDRAAKVAAVAGRVVETPQLWYPDGMERPDYAFDNDSASLSTSLRGGSAAAGTRGSASAHSGAGAPPPGARRPISEGTLAAFAFADESQRPGDEFSMPCLPSDLTQQPASPRGGGDDDDDSDGEEVLEEGAVDAMAARPRPLPPLGPPDASREAMPPPPPKAPTPKKKRARPPRAAAPAPEPVPAPPDPAPPDDDDDRPLVEEGAAAFRRDPNLVIDAEPFSAMFSDSQFNDLMSLAGVASSNSGGEPSPKKPKTTRKKAKKPKAKKGGSSFFSDVMNAVGPGDS